MPVYNIYPDIIIRMNLACGFWPFILVTVFLKDNPNFVHTNTES